jgi:hypothetical protein
MENSLVKRNEAERKEKENAKRSLLSAEMLETAQAPKDRAPPGNERPSALVSTV